MTAPPPAVALVTRFIDSINRRDLASLSALMSSDHRLEVFDEPPLVGKLANRDAWGGYFKRFPNYVIHPHQMAERGQSVAVLGHTTGSHLELPDADERKLTLMWIADTKNGSITRWKLVEDRPRTRGAWGLDTP